MFLSVYLFRSRSRKNLTGSKFETVEKIFETAREKVDFKSLIFYKQLL